MNATAMLALLCRLARSVARHVDGDAVLLVLNSRAGYY
jgi:hypothetical protein